VRTPTSGRSTMVELERIRSGDAEAVGLLLAETWAPLVTYLLIFLGSIDAAEDAAQEAFVRLWEHRDRWVSGSARAVVFRIGRNVALDLSRRARVRRRWRRAHRSDPSRSPPTPEEELTHTEALLRFRGALESLPPRRREVFELIRLRGLSHRDVAHVLDISDRTVANHLRLAMRDLRDLLSDRAAEEPVSDDHARKGRSSDG
jgi:RNA polymerase sigma factor (sigma-70 family)